MLSILKLQVNEVIMNSNNSKYIIKPDISLGLDPAGPDFEDHDIECGVNPNSADFVDIIHTDGIACNRF